VRIPGLHLLTTALAVLTAAAGSAQPATAQITSLQFKGFNYVSYYNGGYANADSMPAMVGTGANAVALAFEYGIDVQNSAVYADQNYTEQSSVIAATIAEARNRGLTVMVRPLIDFLDPSKIGSYGVGDWRSTYNPTDAAAFFASYKTMIVSAAQLAQTNGAASLSIGVELDQLTGPAYQSYWTDIITAVRAVFSGKLTYSSEWDDNVSPWAGQHGLTAGTGDLSTQVSFWSELDYLGIDAYPPISDAANPTVAQLVAGWTQTPTASGALATTGNQSLISYFSAVAAQVGLPLVFTEIGYESATDAASQPFGTSTNVYDPTLQANLYTAFFQAWQQSGNNALTGVYFWNWDPNVAEVGPGNGPNFSPQGQTAQSVVTANFSTSGPVLQVTPTTNIVASGDQGGPFSPSSFQYQLEATSGSVGYSMSGVPSWLTASSSSGTVTTAATTITFSINQSASALSPATYIATITFTDTTNNDTAQTVSAALTVDAPPTYSLSVSVTGNGAVTSSPSGIDCGSTCSANFSGGTQVTLDETPAAGATFSGWTGACSGNGGCAVTMNSAASVAATFSSSSGGGSPSSQTWVSAALGSDSNPCTRAAPCRTFAGALANTLPGGEIGVLDAGGFGTATITQAVSIYNDNEAGVAGVLATSGSGIVVAAGSHDVINLAGLTFDGTGGAGGSGVVFNSGAELHIAHCVFEGFATAGIAFAAGAGSVATALLDVADTTMFHNTTGLSIKPTGGIGATVSLSKVGIDQNTGNGLTVDGSAGTGAVKAVIADSHVALNAGSGITATGGTGGVILDIMRVVASLNGGAGIQSNQSNGGTATVTVGKSMLHGNAIAAQSVGGGALLSTLNNDVAGNGTNGSFTGTAGLQ